MDSLKEICCLCLSKTSESFTKLTSKSADNFTYIRKISSLSRISNFMEANIDYKLCDHCCGVISMIYNFRKQCMRSLKLYNSFKKQPKDKLEHVKLQTTVEVKNIQDVNTITVLSNISNNNDANSTLKENHSCNPDSVLIKQEIDNFSNFNESDSTDLIKNINIKKEAEIKSEYCDELNSGEQYLDDQGEDSSLLQFNNKIEERIEETAEDHLLVVDKKKSEKRSQRILRRKNYHSCETCKKSFSKKSNLITHIRIHTGEKPYLCDSCGKSFSSNSDLAKHKLIHSSKKPFVCDVCNKSFKRNTTLVMHKRIHTGEKPFSCEVCNKFFTFSVQLRTHNRLHTGEKYFCDICNESFIYQSHLKKHKQLHKTEEKLNSEITSKQIMVKKIYVIRNGDKIHIAEKY